MPVLPKAPLPPPLRIALAAALFAALIGEAVVLYTVATPDTRFLVGMGIAAVVVAVTSVLARALMGGIDEVAPASRFHTRRFIRLRSHVEQFLELVRRLHRIAVDADRGVRDRHSATQEMDAIEERLNRLVREIRDAAGIEGARMEQASEEFDSARTPARRR